MPRLIRVDFQQLLAVFQAYHGTHMSYSMRVQPSSRLLSTVLPCCGPAQLLELLPTNCDRSFHQLADSRGVCRGGHECRLRRGQARGARSDLRISGARWSAIQTGRRWSEHLELGGWKPKLQDPSAWRFWLGGFFLLKASQRQTMFLFCCWLHPQRSTGGMYIGIDPYNNIIKLPPCRKIMEDLHDRILHAWITCSMFWRFIRDSEKLNSKAQRRVKVMEQQ